jgi:NDP-4-keto-2,6-dideoxyhexose 3-C-methyltransferase
VHTEITKCRICGNSNLVEILDLGNQAMTGIFPVASASDDVEIGPIVIVKCHGEGFCGLLQLKHTYDPVEMYGQNYGYRSGLNTKMINHLESKVREICEVQSLEQGDLVIDIGSNDGTSLGAYPDHLKLVGVDPTAGKFRKYYKDHIIVIEDFFSAKNLIDVVGNQKAKVVTSHSMMYDLDDPITFAKDVREALAGNGIWVFEQSYMPTMLERIAFDTICHEHIEYYGLAQIEWILGKAGLKAIDVQFNDTNGGSFSVTATPLENELRAVNQSIIDTRKSEIELGLDTLIPYQKFADATRNRAHELKEFINNQVSNGKVIRGVGASTKGNCLLQFAGLTSSEVLSIAEINEDKFGCVTPGSKIPIQDQSEVLALKNDYLLVLPWHFRDFFLTSPLFVGQTLLFPLPALEVINR